MTPEQKQEYIDELRKRKGEGLNGAEALLWDVVNETSETLKNGRGMIEALRRKTIETEQTLLRVTGRHQGAVDMLCTLEQQRRDANDAEEKAKEKAAELAKADFPKALERLPAVADCLTELNETISKKKSEQQSKT